MNSDQQLISKYLAGDGTAFDTLLANHQKMVFGLSWRMLGNIDEAEDMTQQAFVNAFRQIVKFNGRSSFKTWIYAITLNLCRKKLRYQKIIPFQLEEGMISDSHENAEVTLLEKQRKEMLQKALPELPFKQRAVITLRINEELSFGEIAKILKCSVNSAKVNFQHGIRRLKKELGSEK